MFIQTEALSDPLQMNFLPGRDVLASGERTFDGPETAAASPLVERLFQIDGVAAVVLDREAVRITKTQAADWTLLKASILGVIMEHFVSGRPVMIEGLSDPVGDSPGEDDPIAAELKELIDTRIRPAVLPSGGDVAFRGYDQGHVILEFSGAAASFKSRIEGMLRHYVPEVVSIRDYVDTEARPGLGTPEGIAVRQVLDEQINPSVASHGGHIALVDVQDSRVFIRLEGGCQGCGLADVTLKQGVEVEIRRAVPSITAVLDVTEHAEGTNPFYQPGKSGASPY